MSSEKEIIDYTREMIGCDNAEISRVGESYYLFTCENRRSEGEWFRHSGGESESVNFDYVERQVIASGNALDKLMEDVRFYVKLIKVPKIDGILMLMEKQGVPKETLDNFRKTSVLI